MRKLKTLILGSLLVFGGLSIVIYSSCSKKDKCDSITCQNGGTCVDGACECPIGFEGPNCEVASRDKFVGSFSAVDDCFPVDPNHSESDWSYNVNIIPAATPTSFKIQNLANSTLDGFLDATAISADSFQIQPTTLSNGLNYSGFIIYKDASTLTAKFVIKQNGNNLTTCTSTFTKQ